MRESVDRPAGFEPALPRLKGECPGPLDEGREVKVCSKCGHPKPLSEFSKNATKKSGHHAHCKVCTKEYKNQHYIRNRGTYKTKRALRRLEIREWLYDLKSGMACQKCGFSHPAAIDFHHLASGEFKEREIADLAMNGYGRAAILLEIQKCVPLCANCHRLVHYDERRSTKARGYPSR